MRSVTEVIVEELHSLQNKFRGRCNISKNEGARRNGGQEKREVHYRTFSTTCLGKG